MDWFVGGVMVRIGWIVGDMLMTLAAFVGLLLVVGVIMAPSWLRQRRCSHRHYRETMSCDAICCDCGKNLGFIGTLRDNEAKSA